MRKVAVLFVLSLLIVKSSFTQIDSVGLKTAMQKLDKALLDKDEAVLKQVLHKNVSYGHSNGWIQRECGAEAILPPR